MSNTPKPLSDARRAGDLLFISGQLPRDASGAMVEGGIEAQARQALANLAAVLEREGLRPVDVVKATIWLTDPAHFDAFNNAYRKLFDQPFPARSTVVSQLVAEGALLEIEAIAQYR